MDLEALLREAVRDDRKRKKEPPKTAYSEDQWVFHRFVGLVHLQPDGLETSLGTFRELILPSKPGTRKLVKSAGTPEAIEIVRGPGWTEVHSVEPCPDTEDETAQIRRYLSRQRTAEIKADLLKISADSMLRELLEDE